MRAAVACLLLALGCAPAIPEGTYVCDATADCPPGMSCIGGRCFRSADAGPCEPQSCEDLRANCGSLTDACGNVIECGTCSGSQVCGAAGIANVCGCAPRCEVGACGMSDDGCGGSIECGSCLGGAPCVDGRCQCVPQTFAVAGAECGYLADGCGGTIMCGTCPTGEACGAVTPNQCDIGGCTPLSCVDAGVECGPASDGCAGMITCPDCVEPETCGGGNPGTPGQCGCTPQTCAQRAAECGNPDDTCGNPLDCGSCDAGYACSAEHRCVCDPDPGEDNGSHGRPHVLGTIDHGFSTTYTTFNLHYPDDQDWFYWGPAGPGGVEASVVELSVGLTGIPTGRDPVLDAYVLCGGSDVGGDPTCGSGSSLHREPLFGAGCRSAAPMLGDERVMVVQNCVPTGYFVHVGDVDGGGTGGRCDPYTLVVDLTITRP